MAAPVVDEVQQAAVQALAAETGAEQEGLESQVLEAGEAGEAGEIAEAGEEGDDQPRRRRRRGGRNRNRRERENGEGGETGDDVLDAGTAIAGETAAIGDEQVTAAPATMQAVATDVALTYASVESVVTGESPDAVRPAEPASEAVAVGDAPAALTDVAADEAIAVQAAAVDSEAAAVADQVATQPEAIAEAVSAQPVAAIAQQAPQTAEVAATQDAHANEPTPVSDDVPATRQSAVVEETPPAVQPAPAPTQAVDNAMPLQEISTMLNAAGLSLASTDPEKLRAAQEAAARLQPAPRVPRERKPLPPPPNEPLVQVETQR